MKKLLIIAAAALLAAACAKTYEVKETTPPAIGFGSWSEHMTKARAQGDDAFASGDDFAVYGNKDKTTPAPVTVFDGVVVSYDGSAWDYSNHVFWDASYDKYTFYAVSPSTAVTNATINAQTGAIELASITFGGANNDVLIADKTEVAKGDGASSTYFNSFGAVHLYFNHAASLVDINVKKSTSLHSSTVNIQSISLDNMKNAGVLSIATGDYTRSDTGRPYIPNITIASWTSPTGTKSYLPAEGVTPVYGADGTSAISNTNVKEIAEDTAFNPATPATPAASTTLFNHLIVMPQTFGASGSDSSQKISISYTLGNDPTVYSKVAYLADFDTVDNDNQGDSKMDTGFQPGKHYILYLTIDAHEISFTAEIAPWTDVTGYHYLIN